MMELTTENLEAILRSPVLRENILTALINHGIEHEDLEKPVSELDQDSLDYLADAASDALLGCGLVVESYEAEQDKGAYSINIIGVPGAYYVEAPEYDEMGLFVTLKDAREGLKRRYGEFLLR